MLGLRAFVLLIATFVVATMCASCTKGSPSDSSMTSSGAPLAASAPKSSPLNVKDSNSPHAVIDFLDDKATDCSFGHRGVLLDLGDPSTRSRMSGSHLAAPDVDVREHEGASWIGVRSRSLELSFVSSSELKSEAGVVIEARVRGATAKSASVYLNTKPIGTLSFTKGETGVVSTRAPGVVITKGTNELLLRFNGGGSRSARESSHEELAEIDWIRVGPNDGEAPYSAPTRSDAVTTVSIANVPRRSVSLRAPGFARCSAFIPNGSVLEGFIGVTGGEAEAEVHVLVDRAEPRVIGSFHLGGPTDPPGWRPLSLPLGDVATIAGVELVAKSTTKGARVAFAEARVATPPPLVANDDAAAAMKASLAKARGVIMVVLGSTSRRLLGPYGGTIAMSELTNLASNGGVVFDAHRATSTFSSGAMGSMLTGMYPREHGASDADAMLSSTVFTVAEAARQAGVVTGFFTANPTTSAPFGFSRGWETFITHLPGDETPATTVFDDVGPWLEGHKDDRFFVVVHARGGHPPWDVTSDEVKDLPPSNYQGSLEPKHAGEALAKARKAGGGRSFADPDRERAFALHSKALAAHDAALGTLVARVRTIGREKDTVWIVTGDIGIDAASRVPFLDEETLEEGALAVPLIIRAPDSKPGAREHVSIATSGVDIAPTILEALGLPPPAQLRGESLWSLQSKKTLERPLIAETTLRFSAKWGAFALSTLKNHEVKVCNLSLDPDCVSDVRPSHPLAAELLHSLAWSELVVRTAPSPSPIPTASTGPAIPPPPAKVAVDAPTSAALRAWGR